MSAGGASRSDVRDDPQVTSEVRCDVMVAITDDARLLGLAGGQWDNSSCSVADVAFDVDC